MGEDYTLWYEGWELWRVLLLWGIALAMPTIIVMAAAWQDKRKADEYRKLDR